MKHRASVTDTLGGLGGYRTVFEILFRAYTAGKRLVLNLKALTW